MPKRQARKKLQILKEIAAPIKNLAEFAGWAYVKFALMVCLARRSKSALAYLTGE